MLIRNPTIDGYVQVNGDMTITGTINGSAPGGSVSETTYQQFKSGQSEINNDIIKSIDGYVVGDGSVDGYIWNWNTIQTIDFQNGWLSYPSNPFERAGIHKDPFGRVTLRGLIYGGTVGSVAYQLPVGYRPGATMLFAVFSNGAVGRLDISVDGEVTPQTPCANNYVSLDGIHFICSTAPYGKYFLIK